MVVNRQWSLSILLFLSAISWALSYTYNFVLVSQSLQVPVLNAGNTVVGESVFMIGGLDNDGGFPINSTREFNARTKTWTSHPNYAQKLFDPCVVTDGSGKIYVFGGYDGVTPYSNIRGTYTISTQQWEYGTVPFTASTATCIWNSYSNRVHIFLEVGDIWIYNPTDDSYITASSTPDITVPHYGSVAFYQDNTIYLAGLNLTKYFDNAWIPLQNPIEPRTLTAGFSTSDSVWMLGGGDTSFIAQKTIQRYDIAKDEWTDDGNIPIPLKSHVVARVGPSVFLIGGNVGNAKTDTVYMISCLLPCGNPLETCDVQTGMCSDPVASPTATPIGTPFIDTPTNEPVYVPINSPMNTPIYAPMEVPYTAPIDTPMDAPIASSIPTPIDTPINDPIDTPVASPVSSPVTSGTPSSSNTPVSGTPAVSPMSAPSTVPSSSNTPASSNSPVNANTPASSPSSMTPEPSVSPSVNVPMDSGAPNSSPSTPNISKTPSGSSSPRSILGGVSGGDILTANMILLGATGVLLLLLC